MSHMPTTRTYIPQAEYRLSRDVYNFQNVVSPVGASIDPNFPLCVQQINNMVYSGNDTNSRWKANFWWRANDGYWRLAHDKSKDPKYLSGGGLMTPVNLNTAESGYYVSPKVHFRPVTVEAVQDENTGATVVCEVVYARWATSSGTPSLRKAVITRTSGSYATVHSDVATNCPFSFTGATLNIRRVESVSEVATNIFIVAVGRYTPVQTGATNESIPHGTIEFWKVDATAGAGSAVWTQLNALWQFPIAATDMAYSPLDTYGSVLQWTSFIFASPWSGPGLINASLAPTGQNVIVFNADKHGKAMYFLEKDGFCSDVREIIPTYNSLTPDYQDKMGTTSFKPTGLVQVDTRFNRIWSGLYLSGEFTRTADDGVTTSVSCYLIGNGLLNDSNSNSSGMYTGKFAWSFGARNFFLDNTGKSVAIASHSNATYWSSEFTSESAWTGFAAITDPYTQLDPYMYAFGNDGSVWRANMKETRAHNPPYLPSDDILSITISRSSGSANQLEIVVPRSSLSKFQSGNSIDLRYWATNEAQSGTHPTVQIGSFILEEEQYSTSDGGLNSPVTLRGMDAASTLMANWTAPIDMFFEPKASGPLKLTGRAMDSIPSLAHFIDKTAQDNIYSAWDTLGFRAWGINRPAIFYSVNTQNNHNTLVKSRVFFDSDVDNHVGIQTFGSLFSAYGTGEMAGVFISPPTKLPIYGSLGTAEDRSGASPTLGNRINFDNSTTAYNDSTVATQNNRFNVLGSHLAVASVPPVEGEHVGWDLPPGGKQTVGINGNRANAPGSYSQQEDTIFGVGPHASSTTINKMHRLAGTGSYKYDANVTIAQDKEYDIAIKTFGRAVLAYIKDTAYDPIGGGGNPLSSTSNKYVLKAYYKMHSDTDFIIRGDKKKYTGAAMGTDGWFKKNDIWPDAEAGPRVTRFSSSSVATAGSDQDFELFNDDTTFDNLGSGVIVPTEVSGYGNYYEQIIVSGALYARTSPYYRGGDWYSTGSYHRSVDRFSGTGFPTGWNVGRDTFDRQYFKFAIVPNILHRITQASGSPLLTTTLGLSYRNGNNATLRGYMIIGDEVIRWGEKTVREGNTSNYEYLLFIPTTISPITSPYSANYGGVLNIRDATLYNSYTGLYYHLPGVESVWKGWNNSGTAGMGADAMVLALQPFAVQRSNYTDLHVTGYTVEGAPGYWQYLQLNKPTISGPSAWTEGDFAVIWARGQLGTKYVPHSKGEYMCLYPVKPHASASFPAPAAITDSIKFLRHTAFSGPYRSTTDAIHSTVSMAGIKPIFYSGSWNPTGTPQDINTGYFTSAGASFWFKASTTFKNLVAKFRGGKYVLTISAWDGSALAFTGDTSVRAVKLTLTWDGTTNILEEVEVPLFIPIATNLTHPFRVSLSGDVLSVDCMDEQLWTFDLSQYTNAAGSIFYNTDSSSVTVETATTQADLMVWVDGMGDEVEATVSDRGSPFSSALGFLLNGRWVKMNPTSTGRLAFGRYFDRWWSHDFTTGNLKGHYTGSYSESQNALVPAGHVESSGATFAEIVDPSWIRTNGYVFRESPNRLILTAGDARLESRLQIRQERESNERLQITGTLLPTIDVEHGISWLTSNDYVVDSVLHEMTIGSAKTTIACRKYYAII